MEGRKKKGRKEGMSDGAREERKGRKKENRKNQ